MTASNRCCAIRVPCLQVVAPFLVQLLLAVCLTVPQERQEEVREHLEEVWAIDDVPRFGHEAPGGDPVGSMSSMIAAFKFMGIANDPRQVMTLMLGDKGGAMEKTLVK